MPLVTRQIRVSPVSYERLLKHAKSVHLSESECFRHVIDLGLEAATRNYGDVLAQLSRVGTGLVEIQDILDGIAVQSDDRQAESKPLIRLLCELTIVSKMMLTKIDPARLDELPRYVEAQLAAFAEDAGDGASNLVTITEQGTARVI